TKRGAVPSFRGYRGFPASICASVNDEVVHGIPGPRVLHEGDLLSLDVGAFYRGYHGDAATTVPIGAISPAAQRLVDVAWRSRAVGISRARPGVRVGALWADSRSLSGGRARAWCAFCGGTGGGSSSTRSRPS